MRIKTESKRQAILDVAAQAFRELGFDGTSMAEICNRVGGSKATIYNYFPSKEELFFEVVLQSTEAEFEAAHQALDPNIADITTALERFGQGLLKVLYSPDLQALRRLVISESGRSELGRKCYEVGPVRSDALVDAFLRQAMEQGKLRQSDVRFAAMHLKALLEAEFMDRFIFRIRSEVSPQEIKQATRRAVAVFLAAYGVDKGTT